MATNDTKPKKTAARAKPKANASATSGQRATSSGSVKSPKANVTSSGAIAAPKVEPKAAKKPAPKAKATKPAPAKPVAITKAASSAGTAKAPSSPGTTKAVSSAGAIKSPTSNGAIKAPVVEVTPVDEPTPIEQVFTAPQPKVDAQPVREARAPQEAPRAPHKKPGSVVDGWARTQLDETQRVLLERIRAVVKRVAPQATEAVKWAQPVWERNGPFAFFKPSKKHTTFGFWRGAELPDPRGLLEGAGKRMRHLKIALGEKPPLEAIAEFVREAVKRNETAGDQPKRR